MSFPTLDANNSEYYPLPAGLHCQSVLADRFHLEHQKSNFLVVNSFVPLRSGRMICPHKVGQLVKQFL
ncbi:hypothetical protein ABTD87_17000, partial [Acinetobacter baumannii]